MGPDATPRATPPPEDRGPARDGSALLKDCLVQHAGLLLSRAHQYVVRAGLATDAPARELARDLFQALTVAALESAPRYDPARQPLPWLKQILLHQVLRVRDERIRHPRIATDPDHGEVFDWLARRAGLAQDGLLPAQEGDLSAQQQAEQILSLLQPDDREIVELAVLCELNGREIAARLDITPAAARTRLCRALERLRHSMPRRRTP